MRALPVLRELPPGFVVDARPRGVLAVRAELRDALAKAGFRAEAGEAGASALAGRKPLGELACGDERLVVKRFHHGGLLRFLSGARYADAERPFRELVLAARLGALGVPTLELVGARARPAPGFGYTLDLVSRRLDGCVEVAQALREARDGTLPLAARRRLARGLGAFVAGLHARGFLHADLTPRNVLVERASLAGAPRFLVLDLDRSRFVARPSDAERCANLRRLLRWVRRRQPRGKARLGLSDYRRFLAGYGAALGRDAAAQRADWRAIARDAARRAPWHRVGWVLEGLFARARAR